MDDILSEIFQRGKIQSQEEHDIVLEDWKRLFFSGASLDEMTPHNKLLRIWEDEQEEEEE